MNFTIFHKNIYIFNSLERHFIYLIETV